jgi:hypothetical protein
MSLLLAFNKFLKSRRLKIISYIRDYFFIGLIHEHRDCPAHLHESFQACSVLIYVGLSIFSLVDLPFSAGPNVRLYEVAHARIVHSQQNAVSSC